MSLFRVAGAFMDVSGPSDSIGPAYGSAFEVGGAVVPAGVDPYHPAAHAICYPLEGSALFILTAQGPVEKRYVLRNFVLGYPNGCVVVGWYHDRLLDILPSRMCLNDIQILSTDLKINMCNPALYARTPEGRFITGPVWLGAFNPHNLIQLGPQWNQTPSFVLHGRGWYVPSWVFEPKGRVGVPVYEVQMLPDDCSSSNKAPPAKPAVFRVKSANMLNE